MPAFTIFTILIVIASLGVCFATWNRIIAYKRHYKMPESKYTKLFGFITIEHIGIAYFMAIIAHAIISLWFVMTL